MTATIDTPEVALGPGERIVGWRGGTPVVRHESGKAGLTVGVIYELDPVPYDDTEAFDPRMEG
jgi:hypothetical protein